MLKRLYIFLAALGTCLFGAQILPLYAAPAEASANGVLLIENNMPSDSINEYVSAYLEKDAPLTIEQILSPEIQRQFEAIKTSEPDFNYYTKGIWLKVPFENTSASPQDRMLVMHTNFMPEIMVAVVTPSGVDLSLDQKRDSTFGSRPVAYHEPVAPFTLAGNSQGAFYIRYTSEGNTVLPLSLETPLSFAGTSNQRIVIDFLFYGVMAMFIIASIAGRMFWANATFVAYAFYAGGVLLFIFQRDGYAFQYIWPNYPEWNNLSSLPIGCALPVLAALFTRVYLNTKTIHPLIDKLLIGVVVTQILVVASAVIIGASAAKKLGVLTTTVSIVIFVSIGVAAYKKYGRRTLFFVIGWLGILTASVTMTVVHWINIDITRLQSLDTMRVAMVFDALMMGMASVFIVVDLQRDRETLNQDRIAVLDTNLQLHNRLARLEQKYHLAQTLAETNNRLLVDTTHDLRQPLYALRAAMGDVISQKNSGERVTEIEQSLNYIEELVEAALESAIEDDEAGHGFDTNQPEIIDVEKFFSALETMFAADAQNQGVKLIIAPTSQKIESRPFPVLRIMTNFVSNAIKYGEGGRVLIGARRRGDVLCLEVHDTGPGMTEDELEMVKDRFVRGAQACEADTGKGVGLSIVEKQAFDENLQWALESKKGCGTIAKLYVPIAQID